MVVHKANEVFNALLPGVNMPVNNPFILSGIGGHFNIVTVRFLRGNFGPKNGELISDYYVEYLNSDPPHDGKNKSICISFRFSPENNSYLIHDYTKKSGKELPDYEAIKADVVFSVLSACVTMPKKTGVLLNDAD